MHRRHAAVGQRHVGEEALVAANQAGRDQRVWESHGKQDLIVAAFQQQAGVNGIC
jgi:hypothetical protein